MSEQNGNNPAQSSAGTAIKRRVIGRPFPKGVSGNPSGRVRSEIDIKELCRQHTDKAVHALVLALKQPRYRVAAAMGLLAYGYGRPSAHADDLPGTDDTTTFILKVVPVHPRADEPETIEVVPREVEPPEPDPEGMP